MQDSDEVLTVPQAASRLGVSQDAIRKRIRRGALSAWKRDGEWVIPAETVVSPRHAIRPETVSLTVQDPTREVAFVYAERERERLAQDLTDARAENRRLLGIIEDLARRLPELPAGTVVPTEGTSAIADTPVTPPVRRGWLARLLGR